jgi:hypothetical protein
VIPARSRYPSSGIATRRVMPSACLASAVVNGCGSLVQAKPRSMVSPRRRSSAQRSGSIPVSARTSADFP